MHFQQLKLVTMVAVIAIFLPACGDPGDASVAEFAAGCESSTNMGAKICECVGKNAKEDLSPKGFEFLTAMMQKDEKKITALRAEMEFAELTGASLYMVSGPARCAENQ